MIDLNAARRKPPETLLSSLDRLAKSAPRFVEQLREHPSIASRLGPVITAQLPLQVKETAKELSPTIQRILTSILTSPTMTLVHEISEELSPELEEELFDQARRRALALSDITEFRLETQPGQILHVAVIDAAQSPDFANLLRAHHGKATVIMASKWWIFANREYASLQIQTVAPVADTLELAFSGPSRLALALAINRQGRFSVTTSIPTSEADVLAAGLVWTFPFSQEAEASLNRMIQPTQGTVGAT
jgi:hypothetical protein